jgi:hypothetical protein
MLVLRAPVASVGCHRKAFSFSEPDDPAPLLLIGDCSHIAKIIEAFPPNTDGWRLALWLTSANPRLGNRRPVDVLERNPERSSKPRKGRIGLSSSSEGWTLPSLGEMPDEPLWYDWHDRNSYFRIIPRGGDPLWFNPNTSTDPAWAVTACACRTS